MQLHVFVHISCTGANTYYIHDHIYICMCNVHPSFFTQLAKISSQKKCMFQDCLMSNQVLHGQRQHSIHGARSAPLVSFLTENDIPTDSRCWKKLLRSLICIPRCLRSLHFDHDLPMIYWCFLCLSCFILIFMSKTKHQHWNRLWRCLFWVHLQ